MSSFDENADICERKLEEIRLIVDQLMSRRTELEMQIIAIVAKLQDFHLAICRDEDLERVIPLLDEILSEFKR